MTELEYYMHVGGPLDGHKLAKLNSDVPPYPKEPVDPVIQALVDGMLLPEATHEYRLESHPEFGQAKVWREK